MNESKYRHELKYLVSQAQIPLLKSRIQGFMELDPHVKEKGFYNIRSLYFDDYQNRCFYENENGTDPREKFRIRIYDHLDKRISLECKRKERGKTLKTACVITKEQFNLLLDGSSDFDLQPLVNKMILQMHTQMLRPVIIVEYERIPYIYRNGNVRITFDTNMSSSTSLKQFFNNDVPRRPIMPSGQHLLEVKFDEYLPDYLYRALNLGQLQQTAYSKYYLCRKYSL